MEISRQSSMLTGDSIPSLFSGTIVIRREAPMTSG